MKQQNKWEKLFDEFLDLTEFTLVRHQNDWSLIDNQGGNIGDIEGDRFTSTYQILDRMDIYIDDYIAKPLEEELIEMGVDEELYSFDDFLLCRKMLPDNQWDFDVLEMICHHFEEINLEHCNYVPEGKIMIAMLDDDYYTEYNSYPEEYRSNYAQTTYVFDTPEEFIKKWYELDEGVWYWVFVDREEVLSGAVDPDDIEIFEEYFDIQFEEEC